jgi:hypothetical protein
MFLGRARPIGAAAVAFVLAAAGTASAQPGGPASSTGGDGGQGPSPRPDAVQKPDAAQTADPAADASINAMFDHGGELGHAPASAIKPYVDLLDVDDFAARVNATEFIYQTPSVTLETIEPYLLDPNLPAETRSRLEAIGDVLFRVTSRAAMGVQFDRGSGPPIVIRHAVEDPSGRFWAHEVIEPGDVVLRADGEDVSSYDDFQAAILSHDPYETMSLRVRRQGREVDLVVKLGDFNRLASINLPADEILRKAWERRLARIRSAATGPITPVLDLRQDGDGGARPAPEPGDEADRVRQALVVAAGASRGAIEQSGEALRASPLEMDSLAVEVRDYLRQHGLAEQEIGEMQRQLEPLLEMHRQLTDRRARILENMDLTQRRLDDPDLDTVQRRMFTEQLARLEQSLAETQNQINAVNSVLPIGR